MADSQSEREAEKDRGRADDELRLLYASCVSEIASFKQQQWTVTNYGLLLDAAIVAIPKLVTAPPRALLLVLYVCTVAVVVAGWYVIGTLNRAIKVRRRRLNFVRRTFTQQFNTAWRAEEPQETFEAEKQQDLRIFLWVFRTVLVSGALITLLLLVRQTTV
jgi:hypothetical protein